MTVDLVKNRQRYEDVFPDDDSDGEIGLEDEEEMSDSEMYGEKTKALIEERKKIEQEIKVASEEMASASGRRTILEKYGSSVDKERPSDLGACLSAYREERSKTFEVLDACAMKVMDLTKQREKVEQKEAKAENADYKANRKARKEKRKEFEKRQRETSDKLEAKRLLREERARFWPKKVYRVVVSLDTNPDMTPAPSRRGSIESATKPTPESISDACQISLSISYITSSASWAPRYDLSLSTPTNSGLIIYRAEFCNTTSETWRDAKVILSTSQTAFQGLGEPIPTMFPWHIRLGKGSVDNFQGALYNDNEREFKNKSLFGKEQKESKPRSVLFGLDNLSVNIENAQVAQQQQQQAQMQSHKKMREAPQAQLQSFGAPHGHGPSSHDVRALRLHSDNASRHAYATSAEMAYADEEHEIEEETIIPDLPSLAVQESTWAESGLTSTHDIPGLRTIAPSNTTRRHKIASIHLKDTHLSYLLIPKLRAAAFLKARLRNPSSVMLLHGPAGLTLDGSFLGNTTLPRCSAGESFSLSLGVDPSVSVIYGKALVRRSQSGVFNKAGSGIITRTCTVTNTKPTRAIEGLLLDQVPVSEDEKLKVEIVAPRMLRSEGDAVRCGSGVGVNGKEDVKWGKATATVKKAGEVCTEFKIEGGKGAKFVLEYEARFPSGEVVMGV